LGGSFAASLTTWIWQERAIEHHARLTEHISVYDPATQQAVTSLGHGSLQRTAVMIEQMVQSQALMMSTIDYFNMLGVLFLALIAVVFFAKPPFAPKGGGASAAAAGGH